MRRAITAISYMLFGASILIFISALLIPVIKESPSKNEGGKSESYPLNDGGESSAPTANAEQSSTGQIKSNETTQQNEVAPSPYAAPTAELSPAPAPDETAASPIQETGLTEPARPAEEPDAQTTPARIETANAPTQTDSAAMPPQQTPPASTETSPQVPVTEPAPLAPSEVQKPVKPDADSESRPSPSAPSSLLTLGEGYFSSGEVTPRANAYQAIDQIVPIINSRPRDNVLVEGHADKILSNRISPAEASKLNKTVSLRRAIAVAMILEQKGVASDRIIVSGRGDSVPIASNLTEEGRAKNRRVEIKLAPSQ